MWVKNADLHTDCDQHVYVNLPVLDCVPEVLDVVLVSERGTILLEPAHNLILLFGSQKFGPIKHCGRGKLFVRSTGGNTNVAG